MLDFVKTVFGKKEAEAQTTTGTGASIQDTRVNEPLHVTDETFEKVVFGAPVPVMVDFWAPWCGPCRMVAPVVEELARDYDGRMLVAKVNTDENLEVAGNLGIMGIPTLILFNEGQEVDRIVGYMPRKALEQRLLAVLEG